MSAKDYPYPCPTCGVGPFRQCRSMTKGKPTDTHQARVALWGKDFPVEEFQAKFGKQS